jgi:hypothetical protein
MDRRVAARDLGASIEIDAVVEVSPQSISDGRMTAKLKRDGLRAEACHPRVFLKAAGVMASSGTSMKAKRLV